MDIVGIPNSFGSSNLPLSCHTSIWASMPEYLPVSQPPSRTARDVFKNTNAGLYALIFWLKVRLRSLVFYTSSPDNFNEHRRLRATDDKVYWDTCFKKENRCPDFCLQILNQFCLWAQESGFLTSTPSDSYC